VAAGDHIVAKGPHDKKGKVIYVDFRGARGAVETEVPKPLPAAFDDRGQAFTARDVARITGLTAYQVRSLDHAAIVSPSTHYKRRRAYSFVDLVVLRTVSGLLARHVRKNELAGVVRSLRAALAKAGKPLAELQIVSDGQRILVREGSHTFEPLTGQTLIDFNVKSLEQDIVRTLQTRRNLPRVTEAYEKYVRASMLDENPDTYDEAEQLYRRAIELDPWLAMAHTNLGNVQFRQGRTDDAMVHYERALALEPNQPEAHYNVGYVQLERGLAADAVVSLEKAVAGDGTFADAFFYLAMAHEGVGQGHKAAPHWHRYLELAPTGTWADIARQHCQRAR